MTDTIRQKRIIEWLAQTPQVGVPTKNATGFFVNYGTIIKLKTGEEVESLEWLKSEGFKHGLLIGEYSVKHSPGTNEFPERFFFFKAAGATEAPF